MIQKRAQNITNKKLMNYKVFITIKTGRVFPGQGMGGPVAPERYNTRSGRCRKKLTQVV